MFALCWPKHQGSTPRETPGKFGPMWPTPLLIWASDTFDRKLRPNGYKERNGHNGERIGNHHRSFEWCHRWPLRPPFPPKWGFHLPPRYANGHISATGYPIHFMFGSRVGFSGSADWMALFPVTPNPSWRHAAILDNFEWPYLRNGSFGPL